MFNKAFNFFTNIRNADEPTRKLWLVILSGTSMLAVIFMWVIFFNLDIPHPDGYVVEVKSNEGGIITKISEIRSTLGNGLAAVSDKLAVKNRFSVGADDRDFILGSLEPVSITRLP
ncbi:MAG: hypothetical protein Q8O87_02830 [bacterium]|nr:hypothetical protein [bacterium]